MWNHSNYGNDLQISLKHAEIGSHQGSCDDDIRYLRTMPSIQRQLAQLNPETLRRELREYGAWDDEALADHEANLDRWLWISCGDIVEDAVQKT